MQRDSIILKEMEQKNSSISFLSISNDFWIFLPLKTIADSLQLPTTYILSVERYLFAFQTFSSLIVYTCFFWTNANKDEILFRNQNSFFLLFVKHYSLDCYCRCGNYDVHNRSVLPPCCLLSSNFVPILKWSWS